MTLVFVYPSVINFVSAETLWTVLDTMILGGIFYMGLAARKPVFGVSTETSYKVAILLVASSDMLLYFVCFVALSPTSRAMVMAGRSVHLTTLFT